MELNENLTLADLKRLQEELILKQKNLSADKESISQAHPYRIGKNYFIRTVTHHFTGHLVQVTDKELVLVDAAWIPDDGRFNEAIKLGTLAEVEPYPDGMKVIIGRASLIDCVEWTHNLPRQVK